MGILFTGSPEWPDYVPMPSVWLDAARAGVLPTVIVALGTAMLFPERVPVSTEPVIVVSQRVEPPHDHQEKNEPMPPASHFVVAGSTRGGDVPFFGRYDGSSDMAIRRGYEDRRRQAWMASQTWTSTPIRLLSSTSSS